MTTKSLVVALAVAMFSLVGCDRQGLVRKPVLVVEDDNKDKDAAWMSNVLSKCPGVMLGFDKNVSVDYYTAQVLWRDNHWTAILWRDIGKDEYALWLKTGSDYNSLLSEACIHLQAETKSDAPSESPAAPVDQSRFEIHDVRNGNLATSAILDKKTGRVWLWTSVTNERGVKTKSEFEEEKLDPSPN
jgi:hypothetical protein